MRVLTVLSKHRRKVLLLNLMKSLRFIKTLQQTDVRLKELLEVGKNCFLNRCSPAIVISRDRLSFYVIFGFGW